MSEKRYFYRDPLAAAWMEKHFGMRFLLNEKETESIRILGNQINCYPHHEKFEIKIHIHPDSLHLLEPQENDVVKYVEYFTTINSSAVTEQYYYGFWFPTHTAGGITYQNHYKEIIRRNNIAFMWPDVEQ